MMKRLILFIGCICSCALLSAQYMNGGTYAGIDDSDAVRSFKEHVSYLSSPSIQGRLAGSEGEAETADYVSRVMADYGIDLISPDGGDRFGLKQQNGDTLTSRNVIGFIPGYDKDLKDKYILIGAHMDNLGTMKLTVDGNSSQVIFPGANSNASGVAMLLELGRMLKTNSILLRRSVLLVAFGASRETFAGAWYLLNRSFADVENIEAMIDLDALGSGNQAFYAYSFSNPDMNVIVDRLSSTLQPATPKIVASQPFPSDQLAFYDKGIPSILFTTGRFPEMNTHKDTPDLVDYESMEREMEYIYNYSISLANGPKPIFNVEKEIKARQESNGVIPYYDCDFKPSFLGSSDPRVFLEKWVYQYLKYPQQAVRDGIQGKVLVDFIVDQSGNVTDVKVLKGVDELLDNEAVRVISASPRWKPGLVKGKKVKSEISLYVEFRLEKKNKKK